MPKEIVIPEFVANREWTLEDFQQAIANYKVRHRKSYYYHERGAFQRWVTVDTNFHGVWKKTLENGGMDLAKSLAQSLVDEFKIFCEDNNCPRYLRHAHNYYRRCLALAAFHFSQSIEN